MPLHQFNHTVICNYYSCCLTFDISNEKKSFIEIGLYFHSEITRKEAVSRQIVVRIAVLIQETLLATTRSRTGTTRKTTDGEDRIIIKMALRDRQMSNKEYQRFVEVDHIKLSQWILKSRQHEINVKSRHVKVAPYSENEKTRVQWTEQHRHFTVEDWKKVLTYILLISLKFAILLQRMKMFRSVKRRPSEQYHESAVARTIQYQGAVMLWSRTWEDGHGTLYFVSLYLLKWTRFNMEKLCNQM